MQPDVALRVVKRSKEGQSLNVVHVGVGEKEIGIEQVAFLEHDLSPQETNSGTCVDDDAPGPASDLEAGGVAAVFYRSRPRTGNAAPRTPQLELK